MDRCVKETPTKKANRLSKESSPYLLQHAHNPVDWYPWGDEAFEKAAKEDKPVFLSVGYATCHWCHVMEHESFEDEEVAALLNRDFVAIKVDREERPDIDAVYMTVTQALTGSGGWPMTVVMTPEKKPFFAGTYFPKDGKWGRPGMMDMLPALTKAWKEDRDRIDKSTEEIVQALQKMNDFQPGEALGERALRDAQAQLRATYDPHRGGFGQSPKFPTPHNLSLLLRRYQATGDKDPLKMVELTLQQMRMGGIWDHVGYGFHRYSTDAEWLVPHFEKMLYDQALLLIAYTEAYQVTGKEMYAQTAREIMTYVLRDMQSPEGGFYSAEDADSEGEEGKFHVWTADELKAVLGEAATGFSRTYQVTEDGNYVDESTRKRTGTNILHLKGVLPPDRFVEERKRLFDYREKRIHPLKDDKVLTDWNGLMIAAAAIAGRALEEPSYTRAAEKAADFVHRELVSSNGRLLKRYRKGRAGLPAHLDDYAFMVWGLLELYESTLDVRNLQEAIRLNDLMVKHFADAEDGGFFMTAHDAEELLVRQKDIYDGAIPSGNSVAALNLLRLAHMTGDAEYRELADGVIRAFSTQVERIPQGHTHLMMAVDFAIRPTHEVVIMGGQQATDTQALVKALHKRFIPNKVLLHRGSEKNQLSEIAPFTNAMVSGGDKAMAYVCTDFACKLPVDTAEDMLENLGQ